MTLNAETLDIEASKSFIFNGENIDYVYADFEVEWDKVGLSL